ncbi:MAG: hypothetical protein V4631_13385 [Pseudomonadota bacterium]
MTEVEGDDVDLSCSARQELSLPAAATNQRFALKINSLGSLALPATMWTGTYSATGNIPAQRASSRATDSSFNVFICKTASSNDGRCHSLIGFLLALPAHDIFYEY